MAKQDEMPQTKRSFSSYMIMASVKQDIIAENKTILLIMLALFVVLVIFMVASVCIALMTQRCGGKTQQPKYRVLLTEPLGSLNKQLRQNSLMHYSCAATAYHSLLSLRTVILSAPLALIPIRKPAWPAPLLSHDSTRSTRRKRSIFQPRLSIPIKASV